MLGAERTKSRRSQSGFTLIEALVSFVITAVGLLGVAALQGAIVGNTQAAADRSVAATQISNLVARMKSNRNYWQSVPVDFDISIDAAGTITDNGSSTEGAVLQAQNVNCYSAVCNDSQAVAFQLRDWISGASSAGVSDRLAAGGVRVRRVNVTAPVTFEVGVSWDQKINVAGVDMSAGFRAGGSRSRATFAVRVQP